jgi:anti-sigma B factor antagonist
MGPDPGRYRAWTEVYVDLSIATSRQDEVVMLSVAGDVDLATGQQLEREIAEAVDTAGPAGVVVDLGGVGFLDSSGISVLVKGRRQADGRGVPYRVTGASGTIRQVLDITGVWGHLSGQAG